MAINKKLSLLLAMINRVSYALTTTVKRITVSIFPGVNLQNAKPGYASGICTLGFTVRTVQLRVDGGYAVVNIVAEAPGLELGYAGGGSSTISRSSSIADAAGVPL